MMSEENLVIKSLQGDYSVVFEEKITNAVELAQTLNSDCYLLIDAKVWDLYKSSMTQLDRFPRKLIEVTEANKSLEIVGQISEWLVQEGATKSSLIIAIGGGMVQDLATFTAHIYYRGIDWVYLPTTLLSQSDSCIGAKCGLNLLQYKNQLGVIHSPSMVIICTKFLESLEDLDYSSGYGEILKLSLTGELEFYEDFKLHLAEKGFERAEVYSLIIQSLRAKQKVIQQDEYESDLRRILNYGHSFGHVLESLTENSIPHGAAIVFGMDLMNYLGVQWGITDENFSREFSALLRRYFFEYKIPKKITAELLVSSLRTDKKMSNGKMNFAVAKVPGEIVIHSSSLDEHLTKLVENYLSENPIFSFN
jgi:3-dehydroquinate synthase